MAQMKSKKIPSQMSKTGKDNNSLSRAADLVEGSASKLGSSQSKIVKVFMSH